MRVGLTVAVSNPGPNTEYCPAPGLAIVYFLKTASPFPLIFPPTVRCDEHSISPVTSRSFVGEALFIPILELTVSTTKSSVFTIKLLSTVTLPATKLLFVVTAVTLSPTKLLFVVVAVTVTEFTLSAIKLLLVVTTVTLSPTKLLFVVMALITVVFIPYVTLDKVNVLSEENATCPACGRTSETVWSCGVGLALDPPDKMKSDATMVPVSVISSPVNLLACTLPLV